MRVELVREAIDAEALQREIKAGAMARCASSTGSCVTTRAGGETLHLDYEAYEEMALSRCGACGGGGGEVWRAGCGDGAPAGAAGGGRDECADCGGVGASRVRRLRLAGG